MYYFKFKIPWNPDGTIARYPDDWFGVMDKCPSHVTVLLFDDKRAFGVAKCEDTFVPPEITVLKEADALKLVNEALEEDGVYFGQKIPDRWAQRLAEYQKRLFDSAVDKVLNG